MVLQKNETVHKGSVRDVEIMFDRNTGKYCFVNLTSRHVCKCRFDSQEETMLYLLKDNFVKSFEVIKEEDDESKA